jgi:hypothetical protein
MGQIDVEGQVYITFGPAHKGHFGPYCPAGQLTRAPGPGWLAGNRHQTAIVGAVLRSVLYKGPMEPLRTGGRGRSQGETRGLP